MKKVRSDVYDDSLDTNDTIRDCRESVFFTKNWQMVPSHTNSRETDRFVGSTAYTAYTLEREDSHSVLKPVRYIIVHSI